MFIAGSLRVLLLDSECDLTRCYVRHQLSPACVFPLFIASCIHPSTPLGWLGHGVERAAGVGIISDIHLTYRAPPFHTQKRALLHTPNLPLPRSSFERRWWRGLFTSCQRESSQPRLSFRQPSEASRRSSLSSWRFVCITCTSYTAVQRNFASSTSYRSTCNRRVGMGSCSWYSLNSSGRHLRD